MDFARIVIDDEPGVAWSVDVVFEIKISVAAVPRQRRRENGITREFGCDDDLIAAALGPDLYPTQVARSFFALLRSVRGLRRLYRFDFDFGPVPSFDRHLADRVGQAKHPSGREIDTLGVGDLDLVFGFIGRSQE